jgi:hypothetical protein
VGQCVTELLNCCHPERWVPPSSGSGLCLQHSQDEARLSRAKVLSAQSARVNQSATVFHSLAVQEPRHPNSLGTRNSALYLIPLKRVLWRKEYLIQFSICKI